MILAIGIWFESAYIRSIGVNTTNPRIIADELLFLSFAYPDEILLIQNDLVIEHYNQGRDYDN